MYGYIIFSMLVVVFITSFFLLWKNRKGKANKENHDAWNDVASHIPDDNIL